MLLMIIIIIIIASCYGLQKLVDACTYYGTKWDIKFNPLKSQLIALGGHNPSSCAISLNGNQIPWVPMDYGEISWPSVFVQLWYY